MNYRIAPRALRASGYVALLALAACGDRATGPGATPEPPVPPVAVAPSILLSCRADVRAGVVECGPGSGEGSASAGGARLQQHVLGGQGTNVRLTSSGVSYAGDVFSFNVTVQNLLTLAMATADGATRHDDGIRVFFHAAPTATGGTGSISVANATGTGTFTAAGQSYFQYGGKIGGVDQGDLGADGILSSSESSSAKAWQLNVPATVTSFTFTLLVATETPPGAVETIAPQVTGVSPATLVPGSTATLTGFNFNATPGSNTVTIGGRTATVTGGTGTTQLTVTVPCAASGSANVQVTDAGRTGNAFPHPLQVPQRTIAAGQMAVVPAAETGCSELPASGGASRYVVAVYNISTSPGSTTSFQLSADEDAAAAAAQAAPALAARPRVVRAPMGGGVGLDAQMEMARERRSDDVHARLLETNRREGERLRALYRNDPRMGARRNVVVNADPPPLTKTIRVFNLNGSSCSNYTSVNATRVYYNGKIAIYEDDAAPAGLKAAANATMQSYYNAIGDQFNADMEPIIRDNFGDPLLRDAVTDNNGVLVALFTTALAGTGAAGFVVSCDQYPNGVGNESSNFGEYFYAVLPTVVGTGYSSDTPDSWYRTIRSTFIHETKHVASQARRVSTGAPFENSWLEEGTARHSEELWARNSIYNVAWKGNTGYGSSGALGSIYCDVRPNTAGCTATNPRRPSLNMFRHFSVLYTFMANPRSYSPFGATAAGGSSFYATSWSLVRYAIDRYGASDAAFLTALTSSSTSGSTNLTERAGVPLDQLMGGWAVSLYMDDYPGLAGASADTQMPTWNFDSMFAGLNTDFPSTYTLSYPLAPTALAFGSFGTASIPSIAGGGVSYFELSGNHLQPQLLRLTGAGGGALPSTLRVAIGRIQ